MYFQWIQKLELKSRIAKNGIFYFSLAVIFILLFPIVSIAQNQKVADSLIAIDRNLLNDTTQLFILKEIAFNHSVPDTMLSYADTLLELSLKSKNQKWVARSYFQKGNAYRLKGDLRKATENYFKSAKVANSIGYHRGLGGAYIALGDIY